MKIFSKINNTIHSDFLQTLAFKKHRYAGDHMAQARADRWR
jgi:hypothetical protein